VGRQPQATARRGASPPPPRRARLMGARTPPRRAAWARGWRSRAAAGAPC
jgi:hypothetical protein